LKNSEVAIRNGSTAKSNGWDEPRPIEQVGKYEGVFEGDALVVESAVRKIGQELFGSEDLVGTYREGGREVASGGLKKCVLDMGMILRVSSL